MSKNNAEIIKIIMPRTTGLDDVGHGGIPEITPEMVSAALGYGKLPDMASLYCRVKFQFQGELKPKLAWQVTVQRVLPLAIKEDWHCGGVGTIPALSKVALDEALSNNVCGACKGTGLVGRCKPCGGQGKKRFSQAEVARRLGIDDRHYGRSEWKARYNWVLWDVYYKLEDKIMQCLQRLG